SPASRVSGRAAISRRILREFLAALVVAACTKPATADEQLTTAPVQTLQGDDARHVESLTKTIDQLKSRAKFAEAVEPARKVLAICEKALGPDHWRTAAADRTLEDLRRIADLPQEGRRAIASVGARQGEFESELRKARYAEAERVS